MDVLRHAGTLNLPQQDEQMTPDRFRELLTALDWSQRGIARLLNRHEGTVRQWARGTVEIPEDVAIWVEVLGRHHLQNPPPPNNAREGAGSQLQDDETGTSV